MPITGGGVTISFSAHQKQFIITTNTLTATSTDLSFNFSGSIGNFIIFRDFAGGFLCIQVSGCAGALDPAEYAFNDGSTSVLQSESGVQVIATAAAPVPEPAAWAMMLLGAAAVGGALRAGRRRATGSENARVAVSYQPHSV